MQTLALTRHRCCVAVGVQMQNKLLDPGTSSEDKERLARGLCAVMTKSWDNYRTRMGRYVQRPSKQGGGIQPPWRGSS